MDRGYNSAQRDYDNAMPPELRFGGDNLFEDLRQTKQDMLACKNKIENLTEEMEELENDAEDLCARLVALGYERTELSE